MQPSFQVGSVAAATDKVVRTSAGVTTVKASKIGKSKFSLSPLRKLARTTRTNLNRYWGLFRQLYGNPSSKTDISTKERKENRLNEILEAESIASSQNSLNSHCEEFFERLSARTGPNSELFSSELQPVPVYLRRRCYFSRHSLYSSFSSSIDSLEIEMDIVFVGSVNSLLSQESSFGM